MYLYHNDQTLEEFTAEAIALHSAERRITMQSIKVVGDLERSHAHLRLEMSVEEFARHIGLSPAQYWKRARVALMLRCHPAIEKVFIDGEVEFSHLAMITGRITPANEAVLIEGIRNKTKREVESFIARVDNRGRITNREGFKEMTLRFTKPELDVFERVRELLTEGVNIPSHAQVLVKVSRDLLNSLEALEEAERVLKIDRIWNADSRRLLHSEDRKSKAETLLDSEKLALLQSEN